MESKTYVVCRDNIYVGKVLRTNDSIYRDNGDVNYFRTKPGQLIVNAYKSYRNMLFVPNENKLSSDLLYNSPSYPILNVTDDDTCLSIEENSIVIKDAYNLSRLLEFFGYNKELTIEDIIKIRKTFFTGRFGMDNSILFGMKEYIPDSFRPDIIDYNKRYELYKKSLNLGSERHFGSILTSELPRELMSILDESVRCVYGISEDSFKPHNEEGPIKKLTRF